MYLRNYLKLILKSTIICWLIFWNAINIHIPEKTVTQLIRVFKYQNNLFSMIEKTKSYSQHRKAFITFLNRSELNCSLIIPVTNGKDQISVYVHWSPVNPPVSFQLNPKHSNKKNKCGLMFVLWQMIHYIISNAPCAKLFISIERTLIHFIVILNGVYSARISNIYTNIVKDTASHDSGGDSACFFPQWFIETSPTTFQNSEGLFYNYPGLTEGTIETQLVLS